MLVMLAGPSVHAGDFEVSRRGFLRGAGSVVGATVAKTPVALGRSSAMIYVDGAAFTKVRQSFLPTMLMRPFMGFPYWMDIEPLPSNASYKQIHEWEIRSDKYESLFKRSLNQKYGSSDIQVSWGRASQDLSAHFAAKMTDVADRLDLPYEERLFHYQSVVKTFSGRRDWWEQEAFQRSRDFMEAVITEFSKSHPVLMKRMQRHLTIELTRMNDFEYSQKAQAKAKEIFEQPTKQGTELTDVEDLTLARQRIFEAIAKRSNCQQALEAPTSLAIPASSSQDKSADLLESPSEFQSE